MRLRVVIEGYVEVYDLADYGAATIQEAARKQANWVDTGICGVDDLMSCGENWSVKIEGIE